MWPYTAGKVVYRAFLSQSHEGMGVEGKKTNDNTNE